MSCTLTATLVKCITSFRSWSFISPIISRLRQVLCEECINTWTYLWCLPVKTRQGLVHMIDILEPRNDKPPLCEGHKPFRWCVSCKQNGFLEHWFIYRWLGLSSISWTESSVNCVQVDEASQCDISNCQAESKSTDSLNVQKEAQDMLPELNESSFSSASGCQKYRLVEAFPSNSTNGAQNAYC